MCVVIDFFMCVIFHHHIALQSCRLKVLVDKVDKSYQSFVSEGRVCMADGSGDSTPIVILRDTGASQTLLLDKVLPEVANRVSDTRVLLKGFGSDSCISVPLHSVKLESALVNQVVSVGVVSQLPVKGVDMLLGNDLAGDKVVGVPQMSVEPTCGDTEDLDNTFPSCVVTRSMSHDVMDMNDTFLCNSFDECV